MENTAPVGSASVAPRPTGGKSVGGISDFAPAASAAACEAFTSATDRYDIHRLGAPGGAVRKPPIPWLPFMISG